MVAPGYFKAPGKPGARPVTPTTGIWLRALIICRTTPTQDALYHLTVNLSSILVPHMVKPTNLPGQKWRTKCGRVGLSKVGLGTLFKFWIDTPNFNLRLKSWNYCYNPNTFRGWWGRCKKRRRTTSQRRKEGKVEQKSTHSASAGARARTRDLPRARGGSPAARHGSCLDK